MIETIRKIEEWAEARNLVNGSTPQAQMLKLMEETGELAGGIAKSKHDVIVDSVGDVVVVLTILCAQLGIDFQQAVELAHNEIKDRKGEMRNGVFVKEEDL